MSCQHCGSPREADISVQPVISYELGQAPRTGDNAEPAARPTLAAHATGVTVFLRMSNVQDRSIQLVATTKLIKILFIGMNRFIKPGTPMRSISGSSTGPKRLRAPITKFTGLIIPWPAMNEKGNASKIMSFSRMTDDELKAIWMYLQSLPARELGDNG
jgi:hypothetical protein